MPQAIPIGAYFVAAAAVSAGSAYMANRSNQRAAERAARRERRAASAQQVDNEELGREGIGIMQESTAEASATIQQAEQAARNALQSGNRQAAAQYMAYADKARNSLSHSYGQARSDLGSGYQSATGRLSSLADLARYGERAVAPVDSSGFATDPGYNFRLRQGESAVNRSAAAQGGRLGASTLKALSDYNQGMASEEYGNWYQRQMQQKANEMSLANVGYGAIGNMANLDVGYGNSLASMASNYGSNVANLDSNTGSWLGNLNVNEGQALSGLSTWAGGAQSNLQSNLGTNSANALQGLASSGTQLTMATLPTFAAGVPYAGSGWNAVGQGVGTLAQLGAAYYGYGGGASAQQPVGGAGTAARNTSLTVPPRYP
jgi:hypothetical protein